MEKTREFIVPSGTKEIVCGQFSGRADLVEAYIPKSVVRLGSSAFYNCVNLRKLEFEEGSELKYIADSVFQNCGMLEEINMPESVESIRAHAFWGCFKLPSIMTLPKAMKEIETTAFYNTRIETVFLPDECRYQAADHGFIYAPSFAEKCKIIGGIPTNFYEKFPYPLPRVIEDNREAYEETVCEGDFSEKYIVAPGTTVIENNQFSERRDLIDIVIPRSVKKIGTSAFYFCSNLKSVTFEEGSDLKVIEYFVFQNCFALEKIVLPKSLLQIKAHSFWSCFSLTSIELPESLEVIDAAAFFASQIASVKIPEKCRYQAKGHGFPYEASFKDDCEVVGGIPTNFYECRPFPVRPLVDIMKLENPKMFDESSQDKKYIVPQGTLKITSNQFMGRADLEEITVPKSVRVICGGAFYLCKNLKTVVFEDNSCLEEISSYAFQNCHKLESINIPDGVKRIRSHAFWACPMLSNINIPQSVEMIDVSVFYTTQIRKVILPKSCKYQGVRHGFPHEMTFPENCVVEGGISLDLYE